MLKRYIVRLSEAERQDLKGLVSTGKGAAYKIKHANILLNIDVNGPGWTDEQAASARAIACPYRKSSSGCRVTPKQAVLRGLLNLFSLISRIILRY